MRRIVALALVTPALVLPVTVGSVVVAPSASAHPCPTEKFDVTRKVENRVWQRDNGRSSVYNSTRDTVTKTVTFGRSENYSVAKHWEVGATVGGGWGPVKADISANYGQEYTSGTEVSTSDSVTMTIRPGYTGWVRAVVYQRVIDWKRYAYRWDGSTCRKRIIQDAWWGAPKVQLVAITVKGKRLPG